MKQFYITNGLQGLYGSRIFLHVHAVREMLEGTHCFIDQLPHNPQNPVAKVLRENCVWGGSDKRFNDYLGYEVSLGVDGQIQMANIVKVLREEGFEIVLHCPW